MKKWLYEHFGIDMERKESGKIEESFLPGDIVFIGKRGLGVRGVVSGVRGKDVVVYIPKSRDLTPLKLARIMIENPDKARELLAKGKVVRRELSIKDIEYDFSPVHMYLRSRRERRRGGEEKKAVAGIVENKNWNWRGEELIIYRKEWMRDIGDLTDREDNRRVEKLRIFCDSEKVYDYYPDPADPHASRVEGYYYYPAEVWIYWRDIDLDEMSDDIDVMNYREFLDWLEDRFGKRVREKVDDLIYGILEDIHEESWEYAED